MNIIAYFEIQASKPERLVSFYKNIFGWEFTRDNNILIEYYRIKTEGMNGAILKRPTAVPSLMQGTNAFTCSVKVSNFDEIEKLIMANGGQVAMPKFAVPGQCWQGYFIDPDNNVFGIFEVSADAR